MDFNFPLILMCLVFGGAFIWLLDIFWFSKQRGPDEAESFIIENAKSLTPVLAFVFVIRSFLYEPFQIPEKMGLKIPELGTTSPLQISTCSHCEDF